MGSSKQAMKPNGAPKNVPNPNGARKKVHKPIVAPAKATESITTPTKAHTPTTTHGKPDTETAAQRALSIPDILGQIFEAIAKRWGQKCTVLETGATVYHLWPHARMTLSRCARVNTIWFCESTRLLWQYPDFRYLNNLSLLLRRVSPARINLYAASVQLGFMAPLSLNRLPEENNALDGVVFSRIRLLRLHLWTHSGSPDGVKFFLPLIQGPALEVLEIDPYSLTYKPYINRKVGFELARRCRVEFLPPICSYSVLRFV